MLAFAKDITQENPRHPDEDNQPKLKEYMDYQRGLDHEKLIYHSLDHGKTYLQKTINDERGDEDKIKSYLKKAFPVSCAFADSGTLMLMLRKLINSHNEGNSWYQLNAFYFSVVLDCMERFTRVYNRLVREAPDKALEYKISKGKEVDIDDWVRLYFHDLDFMIGKPLQQTHFTFRKRNQAVEEFVQTKQAAGASREQAMENARRRAVTNSPMHLFGRLALAVLLVLSGLLLSGATISGKIPAIKGFLDKLTPLARTIGLATIGVAVFDLLIDLVTLRPIIGDGIPQIVALAAGVLLGRETIENMISHKKVKSLIEMLNRKQSVEQS